MTKKAGIATLLVVCVAILLGYLMIKLLKPSGQWAAESQPGFVRALGDVAFPGGVAIDPAGFVYISDTQNNRVVRFSPHNVLLAEWGHKGKELGSLDYPQGLAFASNRVYVADVHNHRIQVFHETGLFESTWGERGKGPGQFENPYSIAVDPHGQVYVVDNGNNRVQVFTADGGFIREFGAEGLDDGQFRKPQGIAIDSQGNLYVGDGGNNRIQKFTADGRFLASWSCANHDVAIDARDRIFVVSGNSIKVFSDTGKLITKWGSKGKAPGQFDFAARVAVNAAGSRVYVTDANNNRVQVFSK